MKLSKVHLAGLLAAKALAATVPTEAAGCAASSYVTTSGLSFNVDGQTGYFPGTNCYWCSFSAPADVDSTMDHMVASGLRVLRVWGFNDVNSVPQQGTIWFQMLTAQGSTINTGADGLQHLDYVVQAAEQRGIKLIINFVNNWNDYGGINAYVNAFGGSATTWYTNAAAQAQYKKYVAAVVGRYRDSDAIFAWELANEPRCNGCSTNVIYNWAVETSAYIKGLDGNHLVTMGDEGLGLAEGSDGSYPYSYGEGTDFARWLTIDTLDFGTFHLYPNSWGTSYDWGNEWIKTHAAACAAAGKPCLFEEYGAPSDHCAIEAPWQNTSLGTKGMAGDMFWQWGDSFPWGQSSDDGNTIFYGSSEWQCLVKDHVAAIQAKSS
ncbi:Mannan endo-1 [Escovopsis weberi]|uniref:Mannan endo-1,4-beta-mannosidase A n=1 Tax=Escovopsis weberi TaxID=150374 RepID=A0A0M9VT29_ESCWE|nr:Mannan endo-1 [Escovopsis weberi]